jgi:hypothetical protein
MNLKLWIEHYLWQGVEHFYLIDNDSTDEPLSILQEYIDKGLVTYYFLPEKYKQAEHYRFVFDNENLKQKTKWLAVCDLDEFFYGVDKKLTTNIQRLDPYYHYILCNWHMFGSDGNIEHPEDIRTSITHRKTDLTMTKYIFKTKLIKDCSHIWIHSLIDVPYINPKCIRTANKLIKLNHYPIQSIEYFQKVKMTRGDVYWSTNVTDRNMDYFNNYDFKETSDEILKNLILNPPDDYLT